MLKLYFNLKDQKKLYSFKEGALRVSFSLHCLIALVNAVSPMADHGTPGALGFSDRIDDAVVGIRQMKIIVQSLIITNFPHENLHYLDTLIFLLLRWA